MPKRKPEDEYEYIKRKLRRLERKLRGNRDRSESPRRQPSAARSRSPSQDVEMMNALLFSDNEGPVLSPSRQPPLEDIAQPGPSSSHADVLVETAHNASKPAPPALLPAIDAPEPTNRPQPQDTAEPAAGVPPADSATEVALEAEVLELLGIDPTTVKKYGKNIQKDLSLRLEHYATSGLSKEQRKDFKERYLTPDNCKLIDPPELNAELKAAVSEIVAKRDKAIEGKQKQLATAISCISEAITCLMSSKEKNNDILKLLIDGARILCDCQHADTTTRRNFILNAVKKEMKDQLQGTKIDKYLFSETLGETLKSAKAITKSGADLKIPAPKAPTKKTAPSTSTSGRNLNWKNPGPTRRQPGPPRMKEPAATSTRGRPSASWKPSQHPQQRYHSRREIG